MSLYDSPERDNFVRNKISIQSPFDRLAKKAMIEIGKESEIDETEYNSIISIN